MVVYRRHRRDCKVGHLEDSRSGEFDERRKGWKRCDCPIFASGTINRRFRRQSTGTWEWEAAKGIAGQWQAAGAWGEAVASITSEPAGETLPGRMTILAAAEAFIANNRNRELSVASLSKYR